MSAIDMAPELRESASLSPSNLRAAPLAGTGLDRRTETSKLATPIKTDDGDTVTEAVTKITWTANSTDTAIKPGSSRSSRSPRPTAKD
jgi:hypothetical protein